ncbi:MAG: hypothetical protein WCY89_09730 [Flavobacteriaceae bacterium]
MEIRFLTKEESKKEQLEAFLKLSGAERFYRFLELSRIILQKFPTQAVEKEKNNFVIEKKNGKKVE